MISTIQLIAKLLILPKHWRSIWWNDGVEYHRSNRLSIRIKWFALFYTEQNTHRVLLRHNGCIEHFVFDTQSNNNDDAPHMLAHTFNWQSTFC